MGLETVYVRHKFSAFKTDEKGLKESLNTMEMSKGFPYLSISVSLR